MEQLCRLFAFILFLFIRLLDIFFTCLAFILYLIRLLDRFLPVVVCSVEVAVVGVSVKRKRDDHVSNIYIFKQKYIFQGTDEGKLLIVTQKIVTRKWNRCVFC